MLPTELLEQILFGSPVHAMSPSNSGDRRLRGRGWAKIHQHCWAKIQDSIAEPSGNIGHPGTEQGIVAPDCPDIMWAEMLAAKLYAVYAPHSRRARHGCKFRRPTAPVAQAGAQLLTGIV